MPISLNKYLDTAALDETVVNIRELVEGLEAEMQDLPYARPDGIYPDMTVGAVIGADSTAQWAQRESTGSGAAIVRSVQGAAIGYNQYVKIPYYSSDTTNSGTEATIAADGTVTIQGTTIDVGDNFSFARPLSLIGGHKYLVTGIRRFTSSTDTAVVRIFDETSNITIAQTTSATPFFANPVNSTDAARLYYNAAVAGITIDLVAKPQLFDLTQMFGAGNEPSTVEEFEQMFPEAYYPYSAPTLKPVQIAGIASTDAQGGELDAIEWPTQTLRAAGSVRDELTSDELVTRVGVRTYQSGDESDPTVRTDGTTTYYPLATPTTTPISPALPMTYRVQQGGTENIIVPDGEISAAPVLTVAEPVNAGDEFARIWAAIESLGYTRNTAQLSRPVSLTDIGSIDEVQKDTKEIDTVKEVTE